MKSVEETIRQRLLTLGVGTSEVSREIECERHGKYTSVGFYGMSGEFIGSHCPICSREERERQEEKERREKERDRIESLKHMNIEPEFHNASLENFWADTDELAHAVKRIRELLDGAIKKIIMVGKNGTGKTHLACAALHELGGKIMTMYEISATIRATYLANSVASEIDVVDNLASVPLLVIDEIGRTKGSDTEANWLSYIIDKRHTRGLPLILISNKHVRKSCDKGGCPECLENYIGEDIMSRLVENGILLRFSGEDWRRKKP